MNLNEFQELSKRTMPYNGEPANQTEFENMLGNYAMGLVGEAIELFECVIGTQSTENIKKELGDVAHYGVGIAALIKFDARFILAALEDNPEKVLSKLLIASKNISESVKKHVYHRHDLADLKDDVIDALNSTFALAHIYNIDFNDMLQMNINKLKTRYPDSFSTADSIKRVDVASNK